MVNVVSLPTLFLFAIMIMIPSTSSAVALQFNFTQFTSSENKRINCHGNASISSTQGIRLTPDERDVDLLSKGGWATYVDYLHLWDKDSGNLSDFATHFTFVIQSRINATSADGLAFFLAPTNSTIGDLGGNLGLAHGNATQNNSAYPFFAVEFDTFQNPEWDPFYDYLVANNTHVGIDINNMVSVTTARWWNNISFGIQNEAWISYNGTTHNLTVIFTHFPPEGPRNATLTYRVDLREFLPEQVMLGFSAATGDLFQTNDVKSWDFNSNLQLDVVKSPEPTSPPPTPFEIPIRDPVGRKKNIGMLIGIIVGSSCFVLGLASLSFVLWRRRRNKQKKKQRNDDFIELSMDNEFEKGNGPKKFSYDVLERATNNFDEGEKLGEGGFGGVYKGFLGDENIFVAVKKVSSGSKQGIKEYASEVKIISKLRHRNLVQLIGWCHEKGELLLVYEIMPNGSLDSHLFKGKSVLNWGIRFKIAQGLASALLYLHEEWEQCVVHRDVKSSNVMLDSSFNAKLGDFGLARLVDHEKGAQTTMLAGTMGYMAPECVITGRASKESDVYSFGIVALEIASGRRPTMLVAKDDRIRTVEWIWELYGMGNLIEAADPKLNAEFDRQEMERLMAVALWCAHPDSNLRPTIRQAIQVLNSEAEMPVLPPTMPVPTYFALSSLNSSTSISSRMTATTISEPKSSSLFTPNTDSSNFTSSSAVSLHSSSSLLQSH